MQVTGRMARQRGARTEREVDACLVNWIERVCAAMLGEEHHDIDVQVRRIGGDAHYTYAVRVVPALRGILIGHRGVTANTIRHLLRLYATTIGVGEDVDLTVLRGQS